MTFTRSIFIFLGALIFSALLWSYVRLSAAYEADVDLPIKLNPPKGYALSSGLPERLHARVRGAGWQILLMNFAKNARFQFDFTNRTIQILPAGLEQVLPKEGTTEGLLLIRSDEIVNSVMMPSELRVLKVEPDSLQLNFRKMGERRVLVVPDLDIQPGRGYVIVGIPTVSPVAVTVVGASNVLDSLKSFPTKPIVVHNAKEDVDRTIDLSDSLDNFVSLPNSPKITVHVDIQAIGERTMNGMPITVDALPPQYEMILIPNTIATTVRGGVDALAKLNASSVHAHVTFDPVIFDTAQTVTPKIDVPSGITLLSEDPPGVRFIIRRKATQAHAAP